MLNTEKIEQLKVMAASECFSDSEGEDVIVDDYAGGNVDDAFSLGVTEGETLLARDILKSMGIEW